MITGCLGADHDLGLISLEFSEHVVVTVAIGTGVVHAQAAHDTQGFSVGSVDDDLQGILPGFDGLTGILVSSPPHDAMIVGRRLLTPTQTDLRVVEERLPRGQAVGQQVHVGTKQLVDGLANLLRRHGRVVAVEAVVTAIVVIDQSRSVHRQLIFSVMGPAAVCDHIFSKAADPSLCQ